MGILDSIPHTAGGLAGTLALLIWDACLFASGRRPFIIRELHKTYGDVVRIAPNELSFASVNSYRDIYGHASKTRRPFEKGQFYHRDKKHLSIIDSKGQDHRNQRKALSNAFSAKALRDQEDVVQHYVNMFNNQLGTWSLRPNGINIAESLNWITFDIIGELAFGESFKAVEAGKTHPWVSLLIDSVMELNLIGLRKRIPILTLLLPFLVPRGLAAKFAAHWAFVLEMTKKRIAKKDTIKRTDFFQHILEHGMMEEALLTENANLLIVAGSETTATALSGCMYYLTHDDKCLAKLQHEVRNAFDSPDLIDGDTTQKLPYLHACIEESLRMYPPVAIGLPRVSHGATIDGHWIPAGVEVSSHNWTLMRDARYWKDPNSYRPERWVGEGFGDNKDAFQPFSLGARACIGINLAYMEMRIILAKMVWKYDFELLSKELDWERDNMSYLLWQKPVMNMKFHPRTGVVYS
ncbi:cytochrome P450 [Didymella exigua CBS 183.55]|uniref:Cytochrome P450 n=1 Tax=Didymella exigua CBS 183.55 TaxID=1150837 RepID=A0A6A5RXZ0_9PLEO|nr:cytochrome P450 [Didymella exigua CBS 183.55]KAF1933365.1 cytochrome P450 [Didymella exigua CBS 183.55]